MPKPPDLARLDLLTGAAAVVLGEEHACTRALATAITTGDDRDLKRAWREVRRLGPMTRLDLVQVVERAAGADAQGP